MKKTEWVPAEVRREFLHAVIEALGWNEEKIFEMGLQAPRVSFVIKLFLGVFGNTEKVFQHGSEIWHEHYSTGEFIYRNFEESDEGGRATVIVKDFDVDPLFCEYLRGYFTGIMKLAGAKNVEIKENKCTFRGDPFHEYLAKWEK